MKEWNSRYNPFNSFKAIAHVKYWSQYNKGIIPFPIFVSLDPNSSCNLNCPHCNAREALRKEHGSMSVDLIDTIIKQLSFWNTRAVCIGGGGEPLLSINTFYLINRLKASNIEIGIVTNGTAGMNLKQILYDKCKWIAVSVDAGCKETYNKMKGLRPKSVLFDNVIDNISNLVNHNAEVTYKFLLHPNNYQDVYSACEIARRIGCDQIHIRPGSDPWFSLDKNSFGFTPEMIAEVELQLSQARTDFEEESFKIFSVTHKFTDAWKPLKSFGSCYAGFTTCYINHTGEIGLCCDRRGDKEIILCNIKNVDEFWGSRKHNEILARIDVEKCPRCTMSHVNEIFENIIIDDKVFYNFY